MKLKLSLLVISLISGVVAHAAAAEPGPLESYVVTRPGVVQSDQLADTLKQHVKNMLAPFKYPRWIEFADELPKTATGKIQRFKLRKHIEKTAGA